MTDRNDGRPRHSASHMHCAVPFFLCPKRNGRRGSVALRGMGCEVGGECIAQPAGVRRDCVGHASALRGGAEVLGKGVSLCGGGSGSSAGNGSRSLRACVGAAWASRSARAGRVAARGREQAFGEEWVVRAARNASSRGGGAEVFGEGAEVLGEGVSLCGGERRSSAGNGW